MKWGYGSSNGKIKSFIVRINILMAQRWPWVVMFPLNMFNELIYTYISQLAQNDLVLHLVFDLQGTFLLA